MGITRQQALDCFASDDLIGIGMEADAVRRRLHPERVVSYIIDRNINYTNFCTEYCTFCAFYRPLKGKLAAEGYILDFDTIYDKIRETVEMGGTGVLMQGGIHPDLKIDWFESLFTGIKQRFPQHLAALPLAHLKFSQSPSTPRSIYAPPSHACATLAWIQHPRRRRRNSRRRSPRTSIARLKCRTRGLGRRPSHRPLS